MTRLLATIALSFALATPAFADTTYGEGVSLTQSVLVSELMAHPDDYVGKKVRVEGLVTDVCKKRGCWIKLASDQEFQELRFKVQDGVIVFPQDVRGKHAVVEGVFAKYEITEEQARAMAQHHAEENGETFDPASITGPQTVYQLEGTGAVVQ